VEYVDALDLHTMTKQAIKNNNFYWYQKFGLSLEKHTTKTSGYQNKRKHHFFLL